MALGDDETRRRKRIRDFEGLALGLFVHYGLYSQVGRGEWLLHESSMPLAEYEKLISKFSPSDSWAEEITEFAAGNGFRYAVLTARHHDGFSLYDTRSLSDFDSTRLLEPRDLVGEFVEACRKHGIRPFLYHTLIDWRMEALFGAFDEYLAYLTESIRLLCENYGEIGGFWFDGAWAHPNAEWRFGELYRMIRELQPDAVIANNFGMENLGRCDGSVDVAVFERSSISSFDWETAGGLYAAEMCESLNNHWGYAEDDIDYKPPREIISDICCCRQAGGNLLLNIGPLPNGGIRPIEKATITLVGKWIKKNSAAIYKPKPNIGPTTYPQAQNTTPMLRDNEYLYAFFENIEMRMFGSRQNSRHRLYLPTAYEYESACWLDTMEDIPILNDERGCYISAEAFPYGTSAYARTARIRIA